jgi:DNA-binding response OmpR family regulator
MCAQILVAEDDLKQAELIRRYLVHEGHDVVVVHDGRSAIDQVRHRQPDLLVLDVMMPAMDGLDVCRILRRESDLPVLMLTARSLEDDLLLGLDLGADDYMCKPFSPRELVARIRTLLRRAGTNATAPGPLAKVAGLAVNPWRREVTVDGELVDCTPGEFELLATMTAEPGRVFTRQQLLERLHGDDRYFTTRTVDMHVMNLRKKIERRPGQPRRIITVYGVGYKLADASLPADAPQPADEAPRAIRVRADLLDSHCLVAVRTADSGRPQAAARPGSHRRRPHLHGPGELRRHSR